MINLDERYHSYLSGEKKVRIDGVQERIYGYGWYCDGNEIKGYYLTTQYYKLYYTSYYTLKLFSYTSTQYTHFFL